MCIICKKKYNNDTTVINCSYCTNVTSLPLLNNLTTLCCSGCTNLTSLALRPEGSSIPIIDNLTLLNLT